MQLKASLVCVVLSLLVLTQQTAAADCTDTDPACSLVSPTICISNPAIDIAALCPCLCATAPGSSGQGGGFGRGSTAAPGSGSGSGSGSGLGSELSEQVSPGYPAAPAAQPSPPSPSFSPKKIKSPNSPSPPLPPLYPPVPPPNPEATSPRQSPAYSPPDTPAQSPSFLVDSPAPSPVPSPAAVRPAPSPPRQPTSPGGSPVSPAGASPSSPAPLPSPVMSPATPAPSPKSPPSVSPVASLNRSPPPGQSPGIPQNSPNSLNSPSTSPTSSTTPTYPTSPTSPTLPTSHTSPTGSTVAARPSPSPNYSPLPGSPATPATASPAIPQWEVRLDITKALGTDELPTFQGARVISSSVSLSTNINMDANSALSDCSASSRARISEVFAAVMGMRAADVAATCTIIPRSSSSAPTGRLLASSAPRASLAGLDTGATVLRRLMQVASSCTPGAAVTTQLVLPAPSSADLRSTYERLYAALSGGSVDGNSMQGACPASASEAPGLVSATTFIRVASYDTVSPGVAVDSAGPSGTSGTTNGCQSAWASQLLSQAAGLFGQAQVSCNTDPAVPQSASQISSPSVAPAQATVSPSPSQPIAQGSPGSNSMGWIIGAAFGGLAVCAGVVAVMAVGARRKRRREEEDAGRKRPATAPFAMFTPAQTLNQGGSRAETPFSRDEAASRGLSASPKHVTIAPGFDSIARSPPDASRPDSAATAASAPTTGPPAKSFTVWPLGARPLEGQDPQELAPGKVAVASTTLMRLANRNNWSHKRLQLMSKLLAGTNSQGHIVVRPLQADTQFDEVARSSPDDVPSACNSNQLLPSGRSGGITFAGIGSKPRLSRMLQQQVQRQTSSSDGSDIASRRTNEWVRSLAESLPSMPLEDRPSSVGSYSERPFQSQGGHGVPQLTALVSFQETLDSDHEFENLAGQDPPIQLPGSVGHAADGGRGSRVTDSGRSTAMQTPFRSGPPTFISPLASNNGANDCRIEMLEDNEDMPDRFSQPMRIAEGRGQLPLLLNRVAPALSAGPQQKFHRIIDLHTRCQSDSGLAGAKLQFALSQPTPEKLEDMGSPPQSYNARQSASPTVGRGAIGRGLQQGGECEPPRTPDAELPQTVVAFASGRRQRLNAPAAQELVLEEGEEEDECSVSTLHSVGALQDVEGAFEAGEAQGDVEAPQLRPLSAATSASVSAAGPRKSQLGYPDSRATTPKSPLSRPTSVMMPSSSQASALATNTEALA